MGMSSNREEYYFVEKKEEVGRCCFTGKSFGENQEFREMMDLIGWIAGVVDFLQERQYVRLSLLGPVIDVIDLEWYAFPLAHQPPLLASLVHFSEISSYWFS